MKDNTQLIIIFILLVIILFLLAFQFIRKKNTDRFSIKVLPDAIVYNENIANSIINAKKTIHIYFQMLRPSSDSNYPSLINRAIQERTSKGDIEIYILTAREYDRIAGACELKNILMENNIFFSNKLRMTDLRYTLIDKEKAIIGLNKDKIISTKYNPSDTWLEINSLRLGDILETNFTETLKTSETYSNYFTHVIEKYTEGKKENIHIASQHLKVPVNEVSTYFKTKTVTIEQNSDTDKIFDVFMAHSNKDKDLILEISKNLRAKQITPWVDIEQIPPGRWFQDIIQSAVKKAKTAAIFIGTEGIGKWQELELRAFISQCVEHGVPVIPVLLPNVNQIPENLIFLKELNWVQFKNIGDETALKQLIWGINA